MCLWHVLYCINVSHQVYIRTYRTITRYSDYTQPLVLSDLEELEGVKLEEQCTGENGE